MKWLFIGITLVVILISRLEWPKLKQKPKKDKAAFVFLLMLGWLLFLFDLPHIAGPSTFFRTIYKPFVALLK
ncbi:hypothetical protein DL346_00555 [Paenibacillus montanisoli]|uniref:Uncharacterized protein n=1 Tax=Paenibacillus montanisoli TaxID=2081970 RepID=A0A328U6J9_9BACL|nr:hypothetical protein DL346_00555 [Paenibacillus montanisoli]